MKNQGVNMIILCSLISVFITGCNETEIKVYNTPKEGPSESLTMPKNTDHPIHWQAAAHWQELPKSDFRVGNYKVSKSNRSAELSISPLPKT